MKMKLILKALCWPPIITCSPVSLSLLLVPMPISTVWLHYRKIDSDDRPSIHCLTVEPTDNLSLTSEHPSPCKQSVGQSTCYPSTRGQRMFVAATGIATSLRQRFSKRSSDELLPSTNKLRCTEFTIDRNDSITYQDADDRENDEGDKAIMDMYAGTSAVACSTADSASKTSPQTKTTVRSTASGANFRQFTSCLSSSSAYFSSGVCSKRSREDEDIASALASALDTKDDCPDSAIPQASSPVFLGRNPFSYQVNPDNPPCTAEGHPDLYDDLSPQPSIHQSPTFQSPPVHKLVSSPPHQPCRSPIISWPSLITPSPPAGSPNLSTSRQKSNSFDESPLNTSPSFLNSHVTGILPSPPSDEGAPPPMPKLGCSTSIIRFNDTMSKPILRRSIVIPQNKAKQAVKTKRGQLTASHGADIHRFFKKWQFQ